MLIDKILRQVYANSTPPKFLIWVAKKQRLARSKLCRNVHLPAKKTSPKAAKNPSVLSLLFLSISFCYCNTFKLIFNFLCSLSRFTRVESSSENFNFSREHLQVQQENLKLNQSCSHFYWASLIKKVWHLRSKIDPIMIHSTSIALAI